jgi:hypothetical protein
MTSLPRLDLDSASACFPCTPNRKQIAVEAPHHPPRPYAVCPQKTEEQPPTHAMLEHLQPLVGAPLVARLGIMIQRLQRLEDRRRGSVGCRGGHAGYRASRTESQVGTEEVGERIEWRVGDYDGETMEMRSWSVA